LRCGVSVLSSYLLRGCCFNFYRIEDVSASFPFLLPKMESHLPPQLLPPPLPPILSRDGRWWSSLSFYLLVLSYLFPPCDYFCFSKFLLFLSLSGLHRFRSPSLLNVSPEIPPFLPSPPCNVTDPSMFTMEPQPQRARRRTNNNLWGFSITEPAASR